MAVTERSIFQPLSRMASIISGLPTLGGGLLPDVDLQVISEIISPVGNCLCTKHSGIGIGLGLLSSYC